MWPKYSLLRYSLSFLENIYQQYFNITDTCAALLVLNLAKIFSYKVYLHLPSLGENAYADCGWICLGPWVTWHISLCRTIKFANANSRCCEHFCDKFSQMWMSLKCVVTSRWLQLSFILLEATFTALYVLRNLCMGPMSLAQHWLIGPIWWVWKNLVAISIHKGTR